MREGERETSNLEELGVSEGKRVEEVENNEERMKTVLGTSEGKRVEEVENNEERMETVVEKEREVEVTEGTGVKDEKKGTAVVEEVGKGEAEVAEVQVAMGKEGGGEAQEQKEDEKKEETG